MAKRENFNNRFAVLVALAGSAVGLGNLWRFPYLVGKNGGAAFIIIYLIIVITLCMPMMMCEFIIGRRSQSNAFRAFKVLVPGTKWSIIGVLGVVAAFIILSFYSVVGGWSMDYLYRSLTFSLTSTPTQELNAMFGHIASSAWEPLIFLALFLGITGFVVSAGIQKGIAKCSKIMMPLLFLMIIIIDIRALMLPDAMKGIDFLFKPDFSKVTFSTILAALGQAFFSLSIGICTILTYSSYVKKEERIINTSFYTVIADTCFALLAGVAIMPAVFSFGIAPGEGPGLVFVTLPNVFAQMTGGSIIALLFFFTLVLAALTSSISLLEVLVSYLTEEFHVQRKKSVAICFCAALALGVLCSLSQGTLAHIKILGLNIFDACDFVSGNILMPFGGLLLVVFAGWKMKKCDYMDELTNANTLNTPKWLLETIYFIAKYLAPLVVLIILISGLIL